MNKPLQFPEQLKDDVPLALEFAYKSMGIHDELMARHQEAMKCRDFEAVLFSGIQFFNCIREAEKAVCKFLRETPDFPKRAMLIDAVEMLYKAWIRPCSRVDKETASWNAKNYKVEHEAEYAVCRQKAFAKVQQLERDEAMYDDLSPMEAERIEQILAGQ